MMSVLVQPTVIEGLTLVIGVFGLLLVAMLFFEVRQKTELAQQTEETPGNKSGISLGGGVFFVADGVIVSKNGAPTGRLAQ